MKLETSEQSKQPSKFVLYKKVQWRKLK